MSGRDAGSAARPRSKRKYVILPRSEPETEPAPPIAAAADQVAGGLFSRSRHELIAEAAYYRAERRGFREGDPDQDWRDAEAEIEELLRQNRPV